MIYKKLIATTIAVTVCILAGSNAMAQRQGGFSGGGFRGASGPTRIAPRFTRAGSRVATGMTQSRRFRNGDHDRHHHRGLDDRLVFFDNFGDPFFYYPYLYGYYPYDYGYDSYDHPAYQGSAGYTGFLVLRLARAGYYHGVIDGVSGNGTRRAIREYESAHGLPADGQIRAGMLTTMGLE